MKFEDELKKATNPWIKRIGNYLLSRQDLKDNLKKENKSLEECFNYVLIEISNNAKKEGNIGYASGDDEEIYALAVHYYDEDDIKVEKINFRTNANGSATASELSEKLMKQKKSKTKDLSKENEKKNESKEASQPKLKKAKKDKIPDNQISLFDLLE